MKSKMILRLLLLPLVMAFFVNAEARTIIVTKAGSGEGYTITETHEDGGWFSSAKSTLKCIAPGPADCEWNIDPRTLDDMIGPNGSNPDWKDLNDHALEEIENLNLSGSYVNNVLINGDFWYRSVVWDALSPADYEIEITIQLASE